MLFDDEAAPVRGSAGKDNPRARIWAELRRLLHAKQEYWIVASSPKFDDFKAFKVRTNSGGVGEGRGEANGLLMPEEVLPGAKTVS